MKKVLLEINGARGYGSEQVHSITLGELKNMVEDYIEYYGEDTEIVTHDDSNSYGASYGVIFNISEDENYDEEE